ncbi:MAG TPA: GDSL-type esterase/lipase family protein [Holophaga sp.]|nr:GDSL-type esterase/lipase family protein [Holophaga sp.]
MNSRFLVLAAGAILTLAPGARGGSLQDFGSRSRQAQHGESLVRILHFGDSHLAAPTSSGYFGDFFRGCYGDGGPGLGLPWVGRMPGVAAALSSGWRKGKPGDRDPDLGLAGAYLETARAGAWARLEGTFGRLRLHFLRCDNGGKASILLDGAPWGQVDLASGTGPLVLFQRDLAGPARSHKVEIQAQGGRVRILGAALEGRSGAAYSALAFNGASASWMNGVAPGLFSACLAAESPSLVLLAFGTNEARRAASQPDQYRRDLEAVVNQVRQGAPFAAIGLVGPPDSLGRGIPAEGLDQVVRIQRDVATRAGAWFFDQRLAMGGPGSIQGWYRSGLAAQDLVHLRPAGYERLADAMLEDLLMKLGQERPRLPVARSRPGAAAPAATPERGSGPAIYLYKHQETGSVLMTNDPNPPAGYARMK